LIFLNSLASINMTSTISNIWIENEHSLNSEFENSETDNNSDVRVTFKNGSEYVATFFTYKNIETLRQKNRITGECLIGSYFWASDMIIVDNISRYEIEKIINQLIQDDEFDSVFKKLKNPKK
jgi:hypothetical protein